LNRLDAPPDPAVVLAGDTKRSFGEHGRPAAHQVRLLRGRPQHLTHLLLVRR
jgi:hypothetical protein